MITLERITLEHVDAPGCVCPACRLDEVQPRVAALEARLAMEESRTRHLGVRLMEQRARLERLERRLAELDQPSLLGRGR